jgi:vacuolar protein sorting-associated protein 13A/C
VGAVTKPVVGLVDLATNVTEGIRNTTTVFDANDLDRLRIPRPIPQDSILRVYSEREALGQKWLFETENGLYANEFYINHLDVRNEESVVIISSGRIICVTAHNLELRWDIPFSTLQGVRTDDGGIMLLATDENSQYIPLKDKSSVQWLRKTVEQLLLKKK